MLCPLHIPTKTIIAFGIGAEANGRFVPFVIILPMRTLFVVKAPIKALTLNGFMYVQLIAMDGTTAVIGKLHAYPVNAHKR